MWETRAHGWLFSFSLSPPTICRSETFRKNNPETPVYCQKVEDFVEESGPTPADFRKRHGPVTALLCSPPCQSFSGSNRNVDHNSEKDLYRKGLSLQFVDAMVTSGALVGVFENVEGMVRMGSLLFVTAILLCPISTRRF